MELDERIIKLAEAINSQTTLKMLNKPPTLTPPSQPTIDINNPDLKLPPVRKRGTSPLFTSEMKKQSPYNKL